jgi:hypothetical protein
MYEQKVPKLYSRTKKGLVSIKKGGACLYSSHFKCRYVLQNFEQQQQHWSDGVLLEALGLGKLRIHDPSVVV